MTDSENKTKGDLSQKFEAISPIEARILFEGHNLPDYWFPQIRSAECTNTSIEPIKLNTIEPERGDSSQSRGKFISNLLFSASEGFKMSPKRKA